MTCEHRVGGPSQRVHTDVSGLSQYHIGPFRVCVPSDLASGLARALADGKPVAGIHGETDGIGGHQSLLNVGANNLLFNQLIKVVTALAVACENNGSLWIFLQKLLESSGDIAVRVCQCLLAIFGFAGVAKAEQGRLPIARSVNITAAIEYAGLIAHDRIVGGFVGRRVIQRLVPMVAPHIGGGMNEKHRDVRARIGIGRKAVGLHIGRILHVWSRCPIVGVGVIRGCLSLILGKALARRDEIKHRCHHKRAIDERPACDDQSSQADACDFPLVHFPLQFAGFDLSADKPMLGHRGPRRPVGRRSVDGRSPRCLQCDV